MTRMTILQAAFLCLVVLAGCSSMRTGYQQPELEIPRGWSQTPVPEQGSSTAVTGQSERWWTRFQDPQLSKLIERVLASSSDLEKATLTLRKALLEAGVSANNRYPKLAFAQDSSYQRELDSGSTDTDYGTRLSLSYELDLWNRVQALAEASELAAGPAWKNARRWLRIWQSPPPRFTGKWAISGRGLRLSGKT